MPSESMSKLTFSSSSSTSYIALNFLGSTLQNSGLRVRKFDVEKCVLLQVDKSLMNHAVISLPGFIYITHSFLFIVVYAPVVFS